jgi:lysine 6-dehydrogenase
MTYRYVVLGAGRQGVALAYDLLQCGEAARVTLIDSLPTIVQHAGERLSRLVSGCGNRLETRTCDVSDADALAPHLAGAQVILSAVPYRFNETLTDLAIAAGASFCDLGGNTGVVRQQLERHHRAAAAGVSIVPDCGLAPGLGNILAVHGVAAMDTPEHVHVRCGGLPQRPIGPLGYKLVFNFQGLINEYSGCGEFLRDGRRIDIPALTELEDIEFPSPVGRCEAAITSGGTSTCAETFLGRLRTYDYKTVRYPGHFAIMHALFELGCFEERLTLSDGTTIEPKALLRRLIEERLAFPEVRDLVVLRCTVRGQHEHRPVTRQYDLVDHHDERTGFTAMERTTAFPAALVAHLQARQLISPGAQPLESVVPAARYLAELPQHDIHITTTVT